MMIGFIVQKVSLAGELTTASFVLWTVGTILGNTSRPAGLVRTAPVTVSFVNIWVAKVYPESPRMTFRTRGMQLIIIWYCPLQSASSMFITLYITSSEQNIIMGSSN